MTTTLTASSLRTLAQCALAAAVHLERGTLDPQAESILDAWAEALPFIRKALGESFATVAETVARRSVGMLLRGQLARDAVTAELEALLTQDERLKDMLADWDWAYAAECLSRTAIGTYHSALVKGQS